jgi:hypothetical protein
MTQFTELYASKKDQSARTPSHLIRLAHSLFVPPAESAFFDPCPADWTPESGWDALDPKQPWGSYNFVNPPFGKAARFFERAIEQQEQVVSVFLVPTRFHTRFFASALPHVRRLCVFDNRLRFVGYKTPLQGAMCFMVFGPERLLKPVEARSDLQPVELGFRVDAGTPCVADVIPNDACVVLRGSVSEPLAAIQRREEPSVVLCPSRLDNRVLLKAITTAGNRACFLCPTLREGEQKNKFFEGSVLLALNGADDAFDHLGGHLKVSAFVLTPSSARDHCEDEYARLLGRAFDG